MFQMRPLSQKPYFMETWGLCTAYPEPLERTHLGQDTAAYPDDPDRPPYIKEFVGNIDRARVLRAGTSANRAKTTAPIVGNVDVTDALETIIGQAAGRMA